MGPTACRSPISELPSQKAITWFQTLQNVDITWTSKGHISILLEAMSHMAGFAGSPICTVHADMTLPWQKPRSRSESFWSTENRTILRLSPPPFWHGAQNWWLIMVVSLDLVYTFWKPDFLISPQLAVTWLRCSWNVDNTRIHWVLSRRCLRLEACDCDCR